MKIGLIQERKTPPDRRVVFSPLKAKEVQMQFKDLQISVEPSDIRIFSDEAYTQQGIELESDLSSCDVLLGVKEVPVDFLIPNRSYFFFSHTIKKQPYNRDLLKAILDKNIQLYDHEVITAASGNRLIGFGRYAGLVGAYNGFRALGQRDQLFDLPKVEDLADLDALKRELNQIKLPNLKICLSGLGKVAKGAKEILDHLNIKQVGVEEYLAHTFQEPVYAVIDVMDYNKRKDSKPGKISEFFLDPTPYESNFMRFAKVTDYFIAGHFYGDNAPYLFTREDAKRPDFKINLIADISCDIDGPVASTIRPSTIADPFYGYDPKTESEVAFDAPGAITVMAVDNLPCELPKDASEGFGDMFAEHVIPAFFNGDLDGILERARMTKDGQLTPRYAYLEDFVEGKE
jgi:alanine dehydrogenase